MFFSGSENQVKLVPNATSLNLRYVVGKHVHAYVMLSQIMKRCV